MRIHARVIGHVQGVGYRYFVVQTAQQRHLTGWVRNCSNGDVECEAQGDEKILKNFLTRLETGHSWARIDAIQKETIDDKMNEKGFEIRY